MNCNAINSWWRGHVTLRTLHLLSIGQLASLTFAATNFTSSFIANLGVDAPVTQSAFSYFTLALVYGGILLYRRQRLQVSWYWYLLLGFVDLQGNFLANKAYQFTSITSVTLLDGCTIAWALILTRLLLGTRYSPLKLFGAGICMLGLGLLLLSDAEVVGGGGGGVSRPILGDILVIVGTMFYATMPQMQEYFVKKNDRVEVVCMIGVYGLLVSSIQLSMLELKSLELVKWSTDIILGFVGYAVSCFMFYTLATFVLKLGGAAMFNLSLLTADIWAVVFRIFFYQEQVDWLYFLAFAIVVFGLIIYSTNEKDPIPLPALESLNNHGQYQLLDNECVVSRNEASNSSGVEQI
ncbi:solute carrier family 35 member F2 [Citrus clementina]|uniref:solute carrier family 35 member F2 n=1 Tax=Citrus clementina TaxID=85681 RepID=UPI000CED2BDE|nr:solute carrier family 35 member F2 [Citrus x clementina]